MPPVVGGGPSFARSANAANEKSWKVEKIRMFAATRRKPSMRADRDITCRTEPMLGLSRAAERVPGSTKYENGSSVVLVHKGYRPPDQGEAFEAVQRRVRRQGSSM